MTGNILPALALTAGAGLATTIGSALGVLVRRPGPRFMGFTLGFSAGVMVLLSFVQLLPGAVETLDFIPAHLGFLGGMLAYFLLDLLVPHEYIGQCDHGGGGHEAGKDPLLRTGLLVALGIGIHNFPEGMATFTGGLHDFHLGLAIAIAIAVHNIPEGLAISAPIYAATGSRRRAFFWSFLSGLSEPAGAAVAALVLLPFLDAAVFGWLQAGVAGIMVAIALDELVPAAKAYGSEHAPILGTICGMAVMALSLWLLQ